MRRSADRAENPSAAVTIGAAFTLRTYDQLAQITALRAGFGISVVQDPIAHCNPALFPVLRTTLTAHLPV